MRDPFVVVAVALCQKKRRRAQLDFPSQFRVGALKFGDHVVLRRSHVPPPADGAITPPFPVKSEKSLSLSANSRTRRVRVSGRGAHRKTIRNAERRSAFHPEPTPGVGTKRQISSTRTRRADSGLFHGSLLRKEDYLESGDSGVAF